MHNQNRPGKAKSKPDILIRAEAALERSKLPDATPETKLQALNLYTIMVKNLHGYKQFKQAVDLVKAIQPVFETIPEFHYLLANALVERGYNKLREYSDNGSSDQAQLSAGLRIISSATLQFERAVSLGHPKANYRLLSAYMTLEHYSERYENKPREVLENNRGKDLGLIHHYARLLLQIESFSEAETVLKTLIEKDPKRDDARVDLVHLYIRQGRYDEAANIAKQIIDPQIKKDACNDIRQDLAGQVQKEKAALHGTPRATNVWGSHVVTGSANGNSSRATGISCRSNSRTFFKPDLYSEGKRAPRSAQRNQPSSSSESPKTSSRHRG